MASVRTTSIPQMVRDKAIALPSQETLERADMGVSEEDIHKEQRA